MTQRQDGPYDQGEMSGGSAVQSRFDALVERLRWDETGVPRSAETTRALLDGVRAALDRVACAETPSSGAQYSAADGTLPPDAILANSFVVRAFIGSGGMADVYHVRHRDLRTDYAVKILKPERSRDPAVIDLFMAEARLMLALRQEGLAHAHALLRHDDGRPFLVLDLIRGPNLSERLCKGALGLAQTRALGRRLAATLAALHAVGLAHGDLSLENILLPAGPESAVLLDFGLADEKEISAEIQDGGQADTAGISVSRPLLAFSGKWSMAAPERLDGTRATSASDIYALGLILYAAATGKRLPMGHDLASARAARVAPPDLSDLPPSLAAVVKRLLEDDPQHRLSAAQVLHELNRRPAVGGKMAGAIGTAAARFFLRFRVKNAMREPA